MQDENKPRHPGWDNLIPVKPGEVRNTKGRGKGTRNRGTFMRELAESLYNGDDVKNTIVPFGPRKGQPMTAEEIADAACVIEAMKGSLGHFREMKDTLHGKLADVLTSDPEEPLLVKHEGKVEVELTGAALIDELHRRGLPTNILEE